MEVPILSISVMVLTPSSSASTLGPRFTLAAAASPLGPAALHLSLLSALDKTLDMALKELTQPKEANSVLITTIRES